MKTEIEVKFLNVDFNLMREKLSHLDAECIQPMRMMRREIIETPELEAKRSFVRIRDEGNKVTLTYKQVDEDSLTGVKEIEVSVSDFNDTVTLLGKAGLATKSFQESMRETWHIDSVEVVLDEWPWLNPYIEIEGLSETEVKGVASRLGFNWDDAVFGRVTSAYQIQYPNGDADKLVTIPVVAFDQPIPEIISGRKEKLL
jgi:adenylate cyclase class 2